MVKKIVAAITDRCNLHCRHCYNVNPSAIDCDAYLLSNFLKYENVRGYDSLCLSGGEPILNWNGLKIILENVGPLYDHVTVTTNGSLLTDTVLNYLEKKVDLLQISLDGTEKIHDILRGTGSFHRIVKYFEPSFRKKHNILPMCTITRLNYDSLNEYLDMLVDMEIPVGSFERYIPLGNSSLRLNKDELKTAYDTLFKYESKGIINIHCNDPQYNVYKLMRMRINDPLIINEISGSLSGCSVYDGSFYVDVRGVVHPCVFSNMVIGNIGNPESIVSISGDSLNSECRRCAYNPVCKGCRACSEIMLEDWNAKDPYCVM